MTIDEAITIEKRGWATDNKMKEADQLGVEALEKIKVLREILGIPLPLPSEEQDET